MWGGLLMAHKLISKELEAELEREAGMSLVWYSTLLCLSEAESGRMRLQDLEQVAVSSQSGMTRLIDRMEAAGHVARERASDDRRGVYARVTPAGRHAFRRAAPTHVRGIHRHFLSHMTEEEKKVVGDVLARIREALLAGDSYQS